MRQSAVLLAAILPLAACASFPELEAAITEEAKRADYPTLIQVDPLVEEQKRGKLSETDGEILLQRAANLRRRASLLRGITEVNDETRRRLSPTLKRLGG